MEKYHFELSSAIPIFIAGLIALILIVSGGSFLLPIALRLVSGIITSIINSIRNAKIQKINQKKMLDRLNEIPNFYPTKTIRAYGNAYIFSVDEQNKNVAIILNYNITHIFSFNEILGCSIDIDGETYFAKSTKRTIGGFLIGRTLFGNAGAIVGGLSGDMKKKSTIKNLTLTLKVRNISTPSIRIECYNAWEASERIKKEVTPEDLNYKSALYSANEVKDIISVIIDYVDRNS